MSTTPDWCQGREDIRIHEAELAGSEIAGQSCERARENEGAELVGEDRKADGAHARFVHADAGQGAAERRVQHSIQNAVNHYQNNQRDIVELYGPFQIERFEARDRKLWTHQNVDTVRSPGDLGIVKYGIEHLREGQCDHDEIHPGCANDQKPDDQGGDGRNRHCRRQGEPQIGRLILWRCEREGIGCDTEICGVAQTDESGMADQEIETQSKNEFQTFQ